METNYPSFGFTLSRFVDGKVMFLEENGDLGVFDAATGGRETIVLPE